MACGEDRIMRGRESRESRNWERRESCGEAKDDGENKIVRKNGDSGENKEL